MNTRVRWVALWTMCALAITPAMGAGPWYVATNGADSGHNGLSWDQAFATISNALTNATSGTIYVSNGVYTLSAQVTVTKAVTIEGANGSSNTIVDGNGAVRCFQLDNASSVLRGLTIRNGYSDLGGGVRLLFGTLDNCLITGNTATDKGGGTYGGYSVDADRGGYQLITNCQILRNKAIRGGGVCVYDGNGTRDIITITHSDISSNTASGAAAAGGGIWWQAGNLTVQKCRIAGNTATNSATSANGIGIYISTIHRSTLVENCEIVDNQFSHSTSAYEGTLLYGGGMFVAGYTNVIRGCLIARNQVVQQSGGTPTLFFARGGGLYFDTTNQFGNVVESCTIVSNYANFWRQGSDPTYLGGSGIYMVGNGADVIRNCVVYSNAGLPDLYFGDLARTNNIYFTCVNPTNLVLGGIGNITNNPQFVNAAAGNYRLGRSSPCLNVGTNVAWMSTAVDLDGNPRLDGGTSLNGVDMGCYEYAFPGGTLILTR